MEFRQASAYELPFPDRSFDAVFSHALLSYPSDPVAALLEMRRVLKPGGPIGVRASDAGGTLLDAESDGQAKGMAAYLAQREGASDPNIGRKLGRLLRHAGFTVKSRSASYQNITESIRRIAPALSARFGGAITEGDVPDFVALAWCETVAYAP